MRFSLSLRLAAFALVAMFAAGAPLPSQAASGSVALSFVKGGWFIGGQAGRGTLRFRGRTYPLVIGGVSFGLTFGGSQTDLVGTVRNIRRPSDVEGVYTAIGAGGAVGAGARVITLQNANGARLELRGRTVGLAFDLDLSGMAISLDRGR
jgi:hypothetical protein